MRVLSITNKISFPSQEVEFNKTWFFKLNYGLIKAKSQINLVCDRQMCYSYLPNRINTQYLLFEPSAIILHLESKEEKVNLIIKSLVEFRNSLSSSIKVILLPTEDKIKNITLSNEPILSSLIQKEKFKTLIGKLQPKYTEIDHQLIFDYIKLAI